MAQARLILFDNEKFRLYLQEFIVSTQHGNARLSQALGLCPSRVTALARGYPKGRPELSAKPTIETLLRFCHFRHLDPFTFVSGLPKALPTKK